jgi:hypothetical protein
MRRGYRHRDCAGIYKDGKPLLKAQITSFPRLRERNPVVQIEIDSAIG